MKTRVYFYQRPNHRLRQRETVNYCPSKLGKRSSIASFTSDLNIPRTYQSPLKKMTIGLLQKFMAINFRPFPKESEDCDFIYTWGVIPMNPRRPFIIEIDNPYVLSFYNYRTFQLFRGFFKRALLSPNCHKIVCMSQACQKNLEFELGKDVAKKSRVVYPYIPDNGPEEQTNSNQTVKILFVSTNFELKGGRELMDAFQKIDSAGMELNIVSKVPSALKQSVNQENIHFHDLMPKEKLMKTLFSQAYVLALPTMFDSFGMVNLEALSFGMSIISTRTYGIPEMCIDGYNGLCLKNPLIPEESYAPFANPNRQHIEQFVKDDLKYCPDFMEDITRALIDCKENISKFRANSRSLFLKKFSPEIRNQNFLELFES